MQLSSIEKVRGCTFKVQFKSNNRTNAKIHFSKSKDCVELFISSYIMMSNEVQQQKTVQYILYTVMRITSLNNNYLLNNVSV